jgi:hypothetical protein
MFSKDFMIVKKSLSTKGVDCYFDYILIFSSNSSYEPPFSIIESTD